MESGDSNRCATASLDCRGGEGVKQEAWGGGGHKSVDVVQAEHSLMGSKPPAPELQQVQCCPWRLAVATGTRWRSGGRGGGGVPERGSTSSVQCCEWTRMDHSPASQRGIRRIAQEAFCKLYATRRKTVAVWGANKTLLTALHGCLFCSSGNHGGGGVSCGHHHHTSALLLLLLLLLHLCGPVAQGDHKGYQTHTFKTGSVLYDTAAAAAAPAFGRSVAPSTSNRINKGPPPGSCAAAAVATSNGCVGCCLR
jgi:hypothetical protein